MNEQHPAPEKKLHIHGYGTFTGATWKAIESQMRERGVPEDVIRFALAQVARPANR